MTAEALVKSAKEAMLRAYSPYSGYKVGAALLCKDGTVYQGCNVENASYGGTNCAERTAFFKAVYDGHREFSAIAICGGKDGKITGTGDGNVIITATATANLIGGAVFYFVDKRVFKEVE